MVSSSEDAVPALLAEGMARVGLNVAQLAAAVAAVGGELSVPAVYLWRRGETRPAPTVLPYLWLVLRSDARDRARWVRACGLDHLVLAATAP